MEKLLKKKHCSPIQSEQIFVIRVQEVNKTSTDIAARSFKHPIVANICETNSLEMKFLKISKKYAP